MLLLLAHRAMYSGASPSLDFILLGTLASIVMIVFAGKEQSRPYHPCKNGRSKAHKINVVFVVLHSGMSMADNLHRTAVCTE